MNCHFCLWHLFSLDAGNFLFRFFCVILAFVPLEKSSLAVSSYSSPGIILLPFGPLTHNSVMFKNLTHTQNGQKNWADQKPHYTYRSSSVMETHTMKLPLHKFYADVNPKGGLGFCRALALLCPVCITAQCYGL